MYFNRYSIPTIIYFIHRFNFNNLFIIHKYYYIYLVGLFYPSSTMKASSQLSKSYAVGLSRSMDSWS